MWIKKKKRCNNNKTENNIKQNKDEECLAKSSVSTQYKHIRYTHVYIYIHIYLYNITQ